MPLPPSNQTPTFFWQGALIMFPVMVLACVGFFSLRQDKILARHEAERRAQSIADDLLPRFWSELTNRPSGVSSNYFAVDAAGDLVFPPSYTDSPVPQVLELNLLTPEQGQLWLKAQRAELEAQNTDSAIKAYREFLETNPRENFAALAYYALGLLLEKQQRWPKAFETFGVILSKYPNAIGESGVPLLELAAMKSFELDPRHFGFHPDQRPVVMEDVCSNAVFNPTPVSSRVLGQIFESTRSGWGGLAERRLADKWEKIWADHETARELYSAVRARLGCDTNGLIWFLTVENRTLTNRFDNSLTSTGSAASNFLSGFDAEYWLACRLPTKQGSVTFTGVRSFASAASSDGSPTLALSVASPDTNVAASEEGRTLATTRWYVCRAESDLGNALSKLVSGTPAIPDYFGVAVDVAGKRVTQAAPDLRLWQEIDYWSRNGGGEKKSYSGELSSTVLASAKMYAAGNEQFKVSIYLTSPNALFRNQHARTFWFGSLIVAAGVAAIIGLIAAYRAFGRQLRLSEMKSNFVSSVSHELRAPIASVRLMAESLERGRVSDAPKQQEYFSFIIQECRRLSSLIENVLDFSRIEQGRKEYEFEPTDLIALVTQTTKLMEPYAAERQVRLGLEIGGRRTDVGGTTSNQCSVTSDQDPESGIQYPASSIPGSDVAVLKAHFVGDGKALQQALINLLDNAIKHSATGALVTVGLGVEDGSQRSEVRNWKSEVKSVISDQYPVTSDKHPASGMQHPASFIMLWVQDEGEGIPASEHEKIFERFYRCGSELRRETQGVGIGLSIVKHIVEAHSGRVVLRSEVGKGSRFTIELPIIAGPLDSGTPGLQDQDHLINDVFSRHQFFGHFSCTPQRGTSFRLSDFGLLSAFGFRVSALLHMERVLIIEDELPMRTALHDVLTAEGYRVLTAIDGESGLKRAVEEKPELVLLDIMMPKLDGYVVCAELRRLSNPVPILMLTAKGQIEDRVTGLDAGADDYLVKPFSTEELLARVRALLRRTRRQAKAVLKFRLGDVEIDLVRQKAMRGRKTLHLTAKEFAMLRLMAEAAGEPISRDRFLDVVWGYTAFPTTRTVDNHIASLRGKVERNPDHPRWIMTIHGVGYSLELPLEYTAK